MTQADAGTPQGGIISPLLANIALSVLDEAIMARGAQGGDQSTQSATRQRRYHGSGELADRSLCGRLRHPHQWQPGRCSTPARQVAGVLAGIGLRLSPSKTRIAHLSEGIDFLGFTLKWRKTRGGGKWYCATMISDKAFRTIKQTIRNLTPRRSPRQLADVIREVNAALRGWTYYFRGMRSLGAGSRSWYSPGDRFVSWQRMCTAGTGPKSDDGFNTPRGVGEPSKTTVSRCSTRSRCASSATAIAA